jgi:hypothetical protein
MTERERLQLTIRHMEESITAGTAWDKANGHNVYRYSAQSRSDRETLRIAKRKLAALDAPAPRLSPVVFVRR